MRGQKRSPPEARLSIEHASRPHEQSLGMLGRHAASRHNADTLSLDSIPTGQAAGDARGNTFEFTWPGKLAPMHRVAGGGRSPLKLGAHDAEVALLVAVRAGGNSNLALRADRAMQVGGVGRAVHPRVGSCRGAALGAAGRTGVLARTMTTRRPAPGRARARMSRPTRSSRELPRLPGLGWALALSR